MSQDVVSAGAAKAPSPRRARRRARTRDALLEAAEAIIRRDGFARARVEDIAERADVSVGTIYVHFGSKDALYLGLVERALETFAEYMALSETPTLGPLQQVLAAGEAYLRFYQDHPHLFLLLATGAAAPGLPETAHGADLEIRQQIVDRTNGLLDRFAARIDAAIAAGEARPVNSRQLANYLWGAWNGVVSLARQPEGLALTEEQIAETLELARWLLREALSTASTGEAPPGPDPAVKASHMDLK